MKINYNNAKDISIEINGKTITGRYVVERGIITVIYGMTQKSTQLGNSSGYPEHLARMLLRELAENDQSNKL